jgi:hypothetical protein
MIAICTEALYPVVEREEFQAARACPDMPEAGRRTVFKTQV